MTHISIDIVSDVVCPWCYIGKKRLEKALGDIDGKVEIETRWRPFQLDPTLPKEGRDRTEYLVQKFGSAERVRQSHSAIAKAGADEGIAFDFDAISVAPNTLDAHRLVRWAATAGAGVQEALVETLFRMYFTEGRNVGDPLVLVEAAERSGMDAAIAETLLHGDADRAAVTEEIATAQRMGVTGVPCFILDGRFAMMGAHPPETLAHAIADVASKKEAAAAEA
jgi:predicted DsbA family dithiol-disulfide isomerase